MKSLTSDKKKLLYLEILSIIAIYFVLFNHTSDSGYLLFTRRDPGSMQFWVYLVLSIISKVSVPLYLLISGALLLNKEPEGLGVLFRKRIYKMSLLLFVVSLLYYLRDMRLYPQKAYGFKDFWTTFYSSETSTHLWYLYMYIAFLLILPFLQRLVRNLEDEYFVYMIVISITMTCISLIERVLFQGQLTINTDLSFAWVPDIILFPCVGYYVEHRLQITKKGTAIACVVSAACIALSAFLTYYYMVHPTPNASNGSTAFHKRFVLIYAISIFVLIKTLTRGLRTDLAISRLLLSMGSCTFGIYLIHKFILVTPYRLQTLKIFYRFIKDRMAACLLYCLCVFLVCYLLVLILKKIPLVRDFL